MPLSLPRRAAVLAAAAALLTLVGCNKGINKITVKGTVSVKGQKLTGGLLKFVGEGNGYYGVAVINADGTYEMTDVVPGEVKVAVVDSPHGSGSSNPADKPTAAPKPSVSIPEKYREPESSGVKYTIAPDTKELNIDLG